MSAAAGFISPLTGAFERLLSRMERRDEREFLPAALEIIETAPSPAARAVAYTIVCVFVFALGWAFLSRVDIVATADGRVMPAGKVKVLQPLDTGVVRAIHVQEGDHVKAGQLLIELDPTATTADQSMVSHDLLQSELDVARLTALRPLAEGRGGAGAFKPPSDATPIQVEDAHAAMRAQADVQTAKLASIDQDLTRRSAEIAEAQANIEKVQGSIPLLEQKANLREELESQGFGSKFALLDAQQLLGEARHDLTVENEKLSQARAARSSLQRQREQAVSEFATSILSDLAKAEEKRGEFAPQLVKARTRTDLTQLRAPVDGVVEQLTVHTVGGVVEPAQRLLTVVPDESKLIVEAALSNRDVGFVRPGQKVGIKVETFNFTRYGLMHGKVLQVSPDVVAADDRGSGDASTAPADQLRLRAPAYVARIALDDDGMMVDGVRQPLRPGMSVTAEIATGKRTIIDYLFSPLAKRTSESLHER